jgi:hypothetical protein
MEKREDGKLRKSLSNQWRNRNKMKKNNPKKSKAWTFRKVRKDERKEFALERTEKFLVINSGMVFSEIQFYTFRTKESAQTFCLVKNHHFEVERQYLEKLRQ